MLAILNAKVKNGSPVAANRVSALVSCIFSFAAEQRLLPPTASPVIGVKKPTKEASHDRVLTRQEIRRIWDACDTQNPFGGRLVPVAAGDSTARRRAVANAMGDIDAKSNFWTIPGEFVKNAHARAPLVRSRR